MLVVRLFGTGRVFEGTSEVKLPSRTWTLPLLAYLLLHRGEVIPRTRLAFALWPDESEPAALQNLRRNLHRLQNALPDGDWIDADGFTLRWRESGDFECDVSEFERLRSEEATLERALSFYGGELLCECSDEWIVEERERLRRAYHVHLSRLVVAHRDRRAFAVAASYAQRLLESDPWHEAALRGLMSARYESGDAAGALAEFETFARRLRAEMNVDPMPETIALRTAIARGGELSDASAGPEIEPKPKPAALPFVGRREELERLRASWLRVAKGRGSIVFVRGEGGIGKSRLTAHFALGAETEGARVLVGTTSSPERNPYQCLASALREALPLASGVALAPQLLAALAELVPELRSYSADVPRLVRLDPEHERGRLLDALTQLFAGLAKPRPLVVILEDLHRAGDATIDAIAGIVPRLATSPVLFLGTCRPDIVESAGALRRLLHDGVTTSAIVELGPLDDEDVRSLVKATGTGRRPDSQFLTALLERSGGNPLFVIELLRNEPREGEPGNLMPDSVKTMITERLASLEPRSKTIAEVAAVAGEAFTVETIRDIARIPNADLLDGLDELLDRHLIREHTGRTHYEYAFTHHLVHTAVYEGIPDDLRRRRHRRAAHILDGLAGDGAPEYRGERAREIAFHYERGGDASRAAAHYVIAAKRAASLYANAEARDLLNRAFDLDPFADRERERFELLLLHSRLSARLGDTAAEAADVQTLETIAEGLDADAVGAVLARGIDLAHRQGDRKAECDGIERLHAVAIASASNHCLAAAAEAESRRAYSDNECDRAVEWALRSREAYERIGDLAAATRATGHAALASCAIYGRKAESERLASECLALAERAGDPETRMSALSNASFVATHVSVDYARAVDFSHAALKISIETGDRVAEARCRGRLGVALGLSSKTEEGVAQFREALSLCEALGLAGYRVIVIGYIGVGLADLDLFAALDWLRRAAAAALESGDFRSALASVNNIADVSWLVADLDGMSSALDDAAALLREYSDFGHLRAWHYQNVGRYLRCTGDVAGSIDEFERLLTLLHEPGALAEVAALMMLAEVHDDLALTYLAGGRPADARTALDRSVECTVRSGRQQQFVLRHHWIQACVYRAEGRTDEARRELELAHGLYLAKAAALADPVNRASYAEIPVNRAVRLALESDRWHAPESPCVVAFPDPARVPIIATPRAL